MTSGSIDPTINTKGNAPMTTIRLLGLTLAGLITASIAVATTEEQDTGASGQAITIDPNTLFDEPPISLEAISSVQNAPFGEWVVVEFDAPRPDGSTWAIQTINGRFEIVGTVRDNWTNTEFASPDQAVNLTNTIPAHALQAFDNDDVSRIVIGEGNRDAWFVADASSPETPQILNALLERRYRVIVLTGRQGVNPTIQRRFICADETVKQAVLLRGEVQGLGDVNGECDTEKEQITEIYLTILGVQRAPSVILNTGRIYQGPTAVKDYLGLN